MSPASIATMEARLARTLERRLGTALSDPELLSQAVALGVPWLLAEPERLRPDRAGRLHLEPDTAMALQRFARSLSWMAHPRYHHGQQASSVATKALRAMRANRVDMNGALALAARFRAVRHGHICRNQLDRAYATPETLTLADSDMVATRLVSESELQKLGRSAGNCLARPDHRKRYAAAMKDGTTAMWRIDRASAEGPHGPIWVMAIAVETNALMELEHTGKVLTVPRDRNGLLAFLSCQGVDCSFFYVEPVLSQHTLSPALVVAASKGRVRESVERLGGLRWRIQIGTPGVLVATPLRRGAVLGGERLSSWMLQGPSTGARSVLSIQRPGCTEQEDDEFFYGADRGGARYMLDLRVRLALRQACAVRPALRATCVAAFATEDPLFIEDWFGPSVQAIINWRWAACATSV